MTRLSASFRCYGRVQYIHILSVGPVRLRESGDGHLLAALLDSATRPISVYYTTTSSRVDSKPRYLMLGSSQPFISHSAHRCY
jgi:hypothetical protein